MMSKTPFSKICQLLGDLYAEHHDSWDEFIKQNEVGLPLAYCFSRSYVSRPTEQGCDFIMDTWTSMLEFIDLPDDIEYSSWQELFEKSPTLQAANEDEEDE
jgi:hypothetical protein